MYGTPTLSGGGAAGAAAGASRDTPTYFGRARMSAAEKRGGPRGPASAASAGVGESMFAPTTPGGYGQGAFESNQRGAQSGFGAENRQQNAGLGYSPARTPGKGVSSSYMDDGNEVRKSHDQGQLQQYRSGGSAYDDEDIDASRNMHGGTLALVRNSDGEDEEMLMPPSNSLLSGMPATPAPVERLQQEAGDEASGLRRRQAVRTPGTSHVGLDLDAPRGLDLSSPLVLASRARAGSGVDGMTGGAAQSSWVTVFGYPTGAGFAVLRHFQNYGEVHEHRNESGNWMHILYSSRVQASRALAQNGHFINVGDAQVMIGVKPCSDPRLASVAASAASNQGMTSTSFSHQAKQSYRVREPDQLQRAPSRAKSVCKRFWAWVLDV
ncbi:Nucleoporin NUP53 [Hondaea fermentalgiana]|uniref:Nucleoporin NUP53 n=1 Tax=Hondaea fermentalgiana TaxID=2315210 RepID=A0A2R5GWJ9_9STRA|nr:Nucleoporin NUP53 [Hondaea fermentalgiana]|eukprot:GBG32314.1 Nucleoporin NUP53 [Hondaea fermentalgiana]